MWQVDGKLDGRAGWKSGFGGNRLTRGDSPIDNNAVHWRTDYGAFQFGLRLVKHRLIAVRENNRGSPCNETITPSSGAPDPPVVEASPPVRGANSAPRPHGTASSSAWRSRSTPMSQNLSNAIAVIGIDVGKNSFHIVGLDDRGAIVLRQKWSRG